MGRDSGSRALALSPGRPLGLGIDDRVDEFARLLREAPLDDIGAEGREWLRSRYEEIVPLVLPAALRSVEHGVPVDPEALTALRRAAARSARDPGCEVGVVLRGALPALRVFSLVVRSVSSAADQPTLLAMSRASFVAHELGTCWAEAWWARRSAHAPTPEIVDYGTADEVELVSGSSDLDESDEKILSLAARGLSTERISRATAYSRQAVAWHLGRLMKACRTPNRTALVAFAFAKGWLRHRPAPGVARVLPRSDGAERGPGEESSGTPPADPRRGARGSEQRISRR
ncbi:hypothetical protein Bra3105_11635 [Brachybacterium halotolerans subsp. kimchii]|uniref:helix-turn-helix transcriptional regulator n=1 Tax=Brachybacterium halotolerans TaxID=2795215 RepID=UPI001E5F3584|nr:hypothetical protein [Brachybacterium halotolerans]UEJ81493.1 hypothetical protein Bra3105_11635 [Brachybacterium halotolerans subsp. kimchii]